MFLAPAILRLQRPELRGRFRIPGGVPVLLLLALAPVAIAVYVFVTVALGELLIGLAYLLVPPLLYLLARRARAAGLE